VRRFFERMFVACTHVRYKSFRITETLHLSKTGLSCPIPIQWDRSVNDLPLYRICLSAPAISFMYASSLVGDALQSPIWI